MQRSMQAIVNATVNTSLIKIPAKINNRKVQHCIPKTQMVRALRANHLGFGFLELRPQN